MNKKDANSSIFLPTWGMSLVLISSIYLMYAPSFTLDYLMNDELAKIGSQNNPFGQAHSFFFSQGRSLFGVYHSLIYNFVGYDPVKIQFVRFVNFVSIAAIAWLLFRFLYQKSKNIYLAFFTILFFFSQLSFQGLIGYSLQVISNSQPSMWLSLCAFYLHFYFFPKRQFRKWIAYAVVFIIFMAAMQSTQTYAYFAMVPLSFLVLTEGKQRNQQIFIFFALALISFILSTLLYKASLEIWPEKAYSLGESSMAALTSSPWFGRINHVKWHETRKGRYQYALATLGIAPQSKEIVFVDSHPQQVGEDELLVDWKKYVAAREQHLNYLINRHLQ
jgi:hypothetical protein